MFHNGSHKILAPGPQPLFWVLHKPSVDAALKPIVLAEKRFVGCSNTILEPF